MSSAEEYSVNMAINNLKYMDVMVVLAEFPNEIALAINISNCPCKCVGCHSSWLAEDNGEILNEEAIDKLIAEHDGITCIGFMGGDANQKEVARLSNYVKYKHPGIRVGWYSGKETISDNILELGSFDYVKVGRYEEALGGLNSLNTNQKYYEIKHVLIECTKQFQNIIS